MEKERKTYKEKKEEEHDPACMNAGAQNLRAGFYCWHCDMPWYNCLCCHEDD